MIIESGSDRDVLFGETPLVANVVDIAMLGDRMVLLMRNPPRVVAYNTDGSVSFAYSPLGEGPGEFLNANDIETYGADSLAILDLRKQSIILLDAAGAFSREVSLRPDPRDLIRFNALLGFSADGSVIVAGFGTAPGREGHQHIPLRVARVASDGSYRDSVVRALGRELFYTVVDDGTVWAEPPFARRGLAAGLGTGFVYANSGSPSVRLYDDQGSLRMVASRVRTPADVTDERARAFIDAKIGDRPDPGGDVAQRQLDMIKHETLPAADNMFTDRATDEVWLKHFTLQGDPDSATVFGAQGRWLGIVVLPPEPIRLIHDRRVYGLVEYANGTQGIVRYDVAVPSRRN